MSGHHLAPEICQKKVFALLIFFMCIYRKAIKFGYHDSYLTSIDLSFMEGSTGFVFKK